MPSPRSVIHSNVARLKSMLPVASYLHLLHQGVMTGFLQRFDPDGKPTGQFDNLAPADRVGLARYLVDKIMPDAPKELALVSAPPTDEELASPAAVARLTSEQLREIATSASSTAKDLTPDVDSPIASVPAPADPRARAPYPEPARAG